jgi:hypothetical protein
MSARQACVHTCTTQSAPLYHQQTDPRECQTAEDANSKHFRHACCISAIASAGPNVAAMLICMCELPLLQLFGLDAGKHLYAIFSRKSTCSGKILPLCSARGLMRLRGNLQLHSRGAAEKKQQVSLQQRVCAAAALGQPCRLTSERRRRSSYHKLRPPQQHALLQFVPPSEPRTLGPSAARAPSAVLKIS